MKVAFDLTDKDLDDLIVQKPAATLSPADYQRMRCGKGAANCIYPHGCPDPVHKVAPPHSCMDPMCKGAVSHQPHANPAPPTQAPRLSLGDRRKLVEEAKKMAGWKGSASLPYDADYD